ncbi:MAG: F0F1 ATP synthase subunit epsilon [Candidatus Methylomirabilis oxygeniifera]|nr:MAG: F0F1 ATP synthase subunit epsilon [Candidatus Methylomirabilis oxyfera]
MAEQHSPTFMLEVVTPQRLIISEEVEELMAPGQEGYFGVWPGHTPFMTTLKIGELSYTRGRKERFLAVDWGYAEVRSDKVIILVESAERPEEIDLARAQQAKVRAEERLRQFADEAIDHARAQAALERALARMAVAAKGRPSE